jgi:hypothetical protein
MNQNECGLNLKMVHGEKSYETLAKFPDCNIVQDI